MNLISHYIAGDFVTVGIKVKVGSIYETADEKGYSHFIEHMLFKKYKKDIDNVKAWGGDINAFTAHSHTYFRITCLSEFVTQAWELLFNMITDPDFTIEFETERGVVLNEFGYMSTNKDVKLYYEMLSHYSKSEFATPIIGTKDCINSTTPEKLQQFYDKWYVDQNMCVIVVGNYDISIIEDIREIEKRPPTMNIATPMFNLDLDVNHFEHIEDGIDSNMMLRTWFFKPHDIMDCVNLSIASSIIGEGLDSILMKKFRDNDGLCYEVYTYIDSIGIDTLTPAVASFTFGIKFNETHSKDYIIDTVNNIFAEFNPDIDTIYKNVTYIRASTLRGYVSVGKVAAHICEHGITQKDYVQRLDQVDQVAHVFNKLVTTGPSLTGVYLKGE